MTAKWFGVKQLGQVEGMLTFPGSKAKLLSHNFQRWVIRQLEIVHTCHYRWQEVIRVHVWFQCFPYNCQRRRQTFESWIIKKSLALYMVVTIRHSINDLTTNTRTFILQINETSVSVNIFVPISDHGWMRLCCSSYYILPRSDRDTVKQKQSQYFLNEGWPCSSHTRHSLQYLLKSWSCTYTILSCFLVFCFLVSNAGSKSVNEWYEGSCNGHAKSRTHSEPDPLANEAIRAPHTFRHWLSIS